jgi:hypothetical protein
MVNVWLHPGFAGTGLGAVRHFFSQRALGRRVIALVAAYTIGLASLIASFDVARAATANAADPLNVICHTDAAGEPSPSSNGGTGNACADACCTGCLMLMAALPPPPATAVPVVQTSSRAVAPIETAAVAAAPKTKSHQSRAPPQSV